MKGVPSDLKNQMPQLTIEAAVESHALLETAVSQLGTGENEIDYWRNGVNINVIYIFTTSQFYPMQFLLCRVGKDLTIGREESSSIPKSQFSEI